MRLPRRIIAALAFAGLASFLNAQPDSTVVVMTSYPQEVLSRFEPAFEAAHPDIDLRIEWRRSDDAWTLLNGAGHGIDVYWAPSLDTFVALADAGRFAVLPLPLPGLPGRIGGQRLDDAQARFAAFEIAGFGFALSPAWLEERDLPTPADWPDLADPRYADGLLLPVPSRLGFSPMLYQSLLAAEGWEAGWRLIGTAAAQGQLLEGGGGGFIEDLATGRVGLVPSIDFFARSAAAQGLPVAFHYAATTLYSPAYIALLDEAPHPAQARAFLDFALSNAGQALLLREDIARLPVRPEVYAGGAVQNPLLVTDSLPAFDLAEAGPRLALLSALFDVQISERHAALAAAQARLLALQQARQNDAAGQASLERVRDLLFAPALDAQSAERLLADLGLRPAAADFPLDEWRRLLAERQTEALALLEGMEP